jgi:hypothetical protein
MSAEEGDKAIVAEKQRASLSWKGNCRDSFELSSLSIPSVLVFNP